MGARTPLGVRKYFCKCRRFRPFFIKTIKNCYEINHTLVMENHTGNGFCEKHTKLLEEHKYPTGLREFLKFCGSNPEKNDRLIRFGYNIGKLNMFMVLGKVIEKSWLTRKLES
jgi:hypothetical protein